MKAFHGSQTLKDEYLNRVRAHRLADELVQGQYWSNGKGCAVACTLTPNEDDPERRSHVRYESELGIPRILARLEDGIFEGLENAQALLWPEQFLSVINSGADLSSVWPKFAHWLLVDEKHGVIQHAKTDRTRKSIARIAELYELQLAGNISTSEDWRKARRDAADAADAYADAYAVYAYAAYAADAYAAYAAAYAVYAAAADAYAADADARKTKRQQMRSIQAEKLLTLLRETT